MINIYIAKGSSGGRSSSSSKSSSKSSSSKSSSGSSAPKSTAPKVGKSTAKPGAKIKTADGKEIQSSTKTPSNSQYKSSKGIVGDNGYTPRFNNYSAPSGSVVYYPNYGFSDYLLWAYIFSDNSPRTAQAVVVQPDGSEVKAQPTKEGIDGLLIINWLLLIILCAAAIAGVVYCVNRLTKKGNKHATI